MFVGIGLTIRLVAARAMTRWMTSLLYGVSAHDFGVHALVLILLAGCRTRRQLYSGTQGDERGPDGGSALRMNAVTSLS